MTFSIYDIILMIANVYCSALVGAKKSDKKDRKKHILSLTLSK